MATQTHPRELHHQHANAIPDNNLRLAIIATAHCLFGCGLGEIVGMIIGMQLGLSNGATLVLAVVLGFVFGLGLGARPLLRAGFAPRRALRTVFMGEALGIAVMEAVDVAVITSIPGAMDAHFTSLFFWAAMAVALAAGYVAALPVNYVMIRRGVRHQH